MGDGEGKPRLTNLQAWLRQIFCGMCMGSADLVPGISGGTIAFIMGIYEGLVGSLKTLNLQTILYLVRLDFKRFFNTVAWEFLSATVFGQLLAFFLFAEAFHRILNNESARVYLYSAFMGLILASAVFCAKQVSKWSFKEWLGMGLGMVIAYYFTLSESGRGVDPSRLVGGAVDLWMVGCGAVAICAMLLPGISGSYLLTIMGAFPIVIAALADFIRSLKQFSFDGGAFMVLASLMIGIIIGAVAFARVLSYLLKHYYNVTIATLTGFMLGAMRSVWPFWTYDYQPYPFRPEKGLQLVTVDPILPDLASSVTWIAALCLVAGFAVVFVIEVVASWSLEKQEVNR